MINYSKIAQKLGVTFKRNWCKKEDTDLLRYFKGLEEDMTKVVIAYKTLKRSKIAVEEKINFPREVMENKNFKNDKNMIKCIVFEIANSGIKHKIIKTKLCFKLSKNIDKRLKQQKTIRDAVYSITDDYSISFKKKKGWFNFKLKLNNLNNEYPECNHECNNCNRYSNSSEHHKPCEKCKANFNKINNL